MIVLLIKHGHMAFQQNGQIRYYTFESLNDGQVVHAIFTRHGGVSPEPWSALNVGALVGDDLQRVIENRRRSFQAVGRDPLSMYDVWQVHGVEVVCTDTPRPLDQPHRKADAILTDNPNVTLFMRFADCVPILLYDTVRRVVGLVHAGWMGTVNQIAGQAVRALQTQYRTNPADVRAAIGPSVCAKHYQVGSDVIEQVRYKLPQHADRLLEFHGEDLQSGKAYFDLWLANQLILEEVGVRKIEVCGICTACNTKDWYSHRGEHGRTGRFGALIGLKG